MLINRLAAVAAIALAGTLVALPAQSSEIQRAYLAHTRTCIGLFFTDTKAHAAQCLPSNVLPALPYPSIGGDSSPAAAPPAPVPEEPEEEECSECGESA